MLPLFRVRPPPCDASRKRAKVMVSLLLHIFANGTIECATAGCAALAKAVEVCRRRLLTPDLLEKVMTICVSVLSVSPPAGMRERGVCVRLNTVHVR